MKADGLSYRQIGERLGFNKQTIAGVIWNAGLAKTGPPRLNGTRRRDVDPGPSESFVESYRILNPTVAKLVALKPFPRLKLTSGRRY
jgi:hypothetical protein